MTEEIIGELADLYGGEWDDGFLSEYSQAYADKQPLPGTIAICDHIRAHASFYRNRFHDPAFVIQLSERLRLRLQPIYMDDTHATFAAYGTVGFIGRWMEGGLAGTSHEIALRLTSVALYALPDLRRKVQEEQSAPYL